MTDESTVRTWVEGYRRAWESNLADDIRAIFTEDAQYRDGPSTPPWVGHAEIVAGWLDQQDPPGTSTFDWSILAIDGDTAVVRGVTGYPSGPKASVYDNLFVLRFAPDGRVSEFTDWFIARD